MFKDVTHPGKGGDQLLYLCISRGSIAMRKWKFLRELYQCLRGASDDLSRHKLANQSTTMPCPHCPDGPFDAKMAVDNKIETCTRTDLMTDQWWMIDLQETKSIYAIKFSFREYSESLRQRQQHRLSGYSIYVSNSAAIKSGELCFKHNGTYLPSLTAEHICDSFGRYIQFVNERYTYIELCDLIILGCDISGYYSFGCNLTCPQHCKNNKCYVSNGLCLTCIDGWTGSLCDQECANRTYGPNCTLPCPGHCTNNTPCSHINGNCTKGCADGWKDAFCDKECDLGTFGRDCKLNCSGQCLNNAPCSRMTGMCNNGCNPGFRGELCDSECTLGTYGTDCLQNCSGHCSNEEPCNHVTGICKNGCSDGFNGSLCNSPCEVGYYGSNCSSICSQNCSDACHHIDGFCTCLSGLMGPPECSQVKSLAANRSSWECDDQCLYVVGLSVSVLLNITACTLLIILRRRFVKIKQTLSSYCITTGAEMRIKTSESHEYQEVNAVSNEFLYQNLTCQT